ncbi:hypothetical protein CEXT_411801 [Caerostris extrusa]|uniref:Uncharacterized protein n=1 Tax=Caerostris extrusa TaxID=172846 RepID=A0AAV4TAE0_CAEEX|nr:hypothetical protein CEXT_411801 [Caerostris extrusa]
MMRIGSNRANEWEGGIRLDECDSFGRFRCYGWQGPETEMMGSGSNGTNNGRVVSASINVTHLDDLVFMDVIFTNGLVADFYIR